MYKVAVPCLVIVLFIASVTVHCTSSLRVLGVLKRGLVICALVVAAFAATTEPDPDTFDQTYVNGASPPVTVIVIGMLIVVVLGGLERLESLLSGSVALMVT